MSSHPIGEPASMIRTCSACGRPTRKTRLALVLPNAAGEQACRARVCGACEARGTLVVSRLVPVEQVTKEVRSGELDRAIGLLEVQLRAIGKDHPGRTNGDVRHFLDGRVQGLESAIAILCEVGRGR